MQYENIVQEWETPQDVDWTLVKATLAEYLREVIATFSEQHPEAIVYGIVIVHGQNRELSVYLNTEEGYTPMPDRFRAQQVNSPAKSDSQLLEELGRWYYDSWEFELYEFKCKSEVNAVNNSHYELFERLYDDDSADIDRLDSDFLQACTGAIATLEKSSELNSLSKTEDFELRFHDANCHGWDTAELLEAARS